ncbi:MAG: efflux RND transporter periplasmic adaptor subunit [Bacteroidales bacterium]|nr:efflux RND transporter periplasmic adaptor subunit [Bacteroidales bacterium]
MKNTVVSLKLCLVLLLALIFLPSCEGNMQEEENIDDEYPVMVVSADTLTITEKFTASIKGQQDVDIYPQVTGTITKVCIFEGEHVRKGQTLFVIDQTPYQSVWEQAKANVHSAEAALELAQLEAESQSVLYAEKIIGNYELQKAQNAVKTAEATLEQAKAAEKEARNNLSYTEVKSPADGVVGILPYRSGSLVSPQSDKPLTSISDCSTMSVYFSVSEKTLRNMQKPYGSRGKMLEAMPEVGLQLSDGSVYGLKGRIESMSGIVNPATGTVLVRSSFPNPNEELLSGSIGEILIPRAYTDAVVIPSSATCEIQDQIYVCKLLDGKVVKQRILVERSHDGLRFVVTEGLCEGDSIVAEGVGLLKEGAIITTRKLEE